MKGLTHSHVVLIAQLVEHCTGNAKVVGSNPVRSLNFSGHFSSSVMAAFASLILSESLLFICRYFKLVFWVADAGP